MSDGFWEWLWRELRRTPRKIPRGIRKPFNEFLLGLAVFTFSLFVAGTATVRAFVDRALNIGLLAWAPFVVGVLIMLHGHYRDVAGARSSEERRPSESTFKTRVQRLRRVVIPKEVCEALGIREGDYVIVVVRKADA